MSSTPTPAPPPSRVASVDAYRGLVMFLMMAEVLRLAKVKENLPGSQFWAFLAHHQEHVTWGGCSLHDLIQPSFSFLVGVALPFSLMSRQNRGEPVWKSWMHAVLRAAILIWLGVFLRSVGQKQTNWMFTDTLSQIGLGYVFLFALGHVRVVWQWVAFAVILIGYWAAFALYPLPDPDFNYAAVKGLTPEQHAEERITGFAAHWDKNTNLATAFDVWFLNQFPRAKPWTPAGGNSSHPVPSFISTLAATALDQFPREKPWTPATDNGGGYATLSFIPTLATMILGLIAGGMLRTANTPWAKIRNFAALGLALLASGWLLDATGICPSVKRIWTPAWVLFSGGWCFLFLAGFAALLDTGLWGGWAYPLMVIGANSIVAYVAAQAVFKNLIADSFRTHFGQNVFAQAGPYESLATGAAVLSVLWLLLWWMYRRKVFVKI